MEEGKKFDNGKLRYDLLPVDSLEKVVEVYNFGAKKYDDHNWRKGLKFSRVYSAIQRHLNSFWKGEDNDPESGLNHLSHACWGTLTLLNFCDTHKELDDRFIIKENILHDVPKVDPFRNPIKPKDKLNIYLAGTTSAIQYRRRFKELIADDSQIIIRDPLEEVDNKIVLSDKDYSQHMKLVEFDKNLIKECDLLVAYVQNYTAGTICEIMYAYENDIPVYLITNDSKVENDPWIISHIDFSFETIKDCVDDIKRNLSTWNFKCNKGT